MVLMFTVSSMPVFGIDAESDQTDNGNDIYFATSGEYGDSAFDNEAGYGDDYVANEPGYDYGYDNGYNDADGSDYDYGYDADYEYKDEDEYGQEEEEDLEKLNISIMPLSTLIGPGTVGASDPTTTVGADIIGNINVNGGTLILDDDFTITGTVFVNNGGTFVMSDGMITGSGTRGVSVTGVNSTFEMTGGTISGNTTGDFWGGGGVYVSGGEFTMIGGTISGNTAPGGGGVSVHNGGDFMMSGTAVLSGNTANTGGGGVYVEFGTFTMSGGEISANTAPLWGGGVHLSASEFTMSGGEITGNTSPGWGGGVHLVSGSHLTMTDGTISDNIAGLGGGVYMWNGGGLTMSGGEISGNTAGAVGGVQVEAGSQFTMSGTAVISGNMSGASGGGVGVLDGEFTMSGGEISGNTAATWGGGVAVFGGMGNAFTMSGGEISGNTAGSGGGGVYAISSSEFTMTGGTMTGNTAIDWGGGVLISHDSEFTMSGGTINNNTAAHGGGVFMAFDSEFDMSGTAQITSNHAAMNGGGIWVAVANRDLLTIANTAIFIGNTAGNGVYDFGLTAGLAAFPNIHWVGFASGTNSTPNPSHLINNFDISNIPSQPGGNGNGGTPAMVKQPDRMTARVGETINWTLRGFHNRSGNDVTDFTVMDMPGRGLNFQSGSLPAFTHGAGITYEIRYRVAGSDVWHVHATGISASQPFNFSLPQPGNLHYTEIGFFFGDVPADFALGNEIVMTFRVGAGAPNNQLINQFLVRYSNIERQGESPNPPIVIPPGGGNGSGNGYGHNPPGGSGGNQPAPGGGGGNQLVPGGDGRYIELDDTGVPLGEWVWDDDNGTWTFIQNLPVPLGASNVPQTGLSGIELYLFMMAMSMAGMAVLFLNRRRKQNA